MRFNSYICEQKVISPKSYSILQQKHFYRYIGEKCLQWTEAIQKKMDEYYLLHLKRNVDFTKTNTCWPLVHLNLGHSYTFSRKFLERESDYLSRDKNIWSQRKLFRAML